MSSVARRPARAPPHTVVGTAGALATSRATPAVARRRRRSHHMHCCCGKRDGGICKSRNVHGKDGIMLPFGEPGTANYKLRAALLRQMGVTFDPDPASKRSKARMMAVKDLRAHRAHFPGNRLTPCKSGANQGVRTIRKEPSANGPVTEPIDTMMEDVEAAEAAAMPAASNTTRSARRRLDDGGVGLADGHRAAAAPPTTPAAAPPPVGATVAELRARLAQMAQEMAERELQVQALRREHAAQLAANEAAYQAELQRREREKQALEQQVRRLQEEMLCKDRAYAAELAAIKRTVHELQTEGPVGGAFVPLQSYMLHEARVGGKVVKRLSRSVSLAVCARASCLPRCWRQWISCVCS
jgi:hypothetical protein